MNKIEKKTLLINGKSYDWASVNVSIGTSLFFGITSVKFTEKQDVKPIYGDNVFPIGYGYGKISTTVQLTVDVEEFRILLTAANEESLFNLPPFPVTISFIDNDDNIPFTYIIYNCKVIDNNIDIKQNATNTYVTINMVASHVLKIPTDRITFNKFRYNNNLIDIYSPEFQKLGVIDTII